MNQPGTTTRDHNTLGTTHPTETSTPHHDTDTATQRRGGLLLHGGLTLITTTTLTLLAAYTLIDPPTWDHPGRILLAGLTAGGIYALACCGIIAGLHERMQRAQRNAVRTGALQAATNARRIEENGRLIAETNRLASTLIAGHADIRAELHQLHEQMAQVVAAVDRMPTWEDGIKQGIELGRAGAGLSDLDQLPMSPARLPKWPSN